MWLTLGEVHRCEVRRWVKDTSENGGGFPQVFMRNLIVYSVRAAFEAGSLDPSVDLKLSFFCKNECFGIVLTL
jgi:hypothetical protein